MGTEKRGMGDVATFVTLLCLRQPFLFRPSAYLIQTPRIKKPFPQFLDGLGTQTLEQWAMEKTRFR